MRLNRASLASQLYSEAMSQMLQARADLALPVLKRLARYKNHLKSRERRAFERMYATFVERKPVRFKSSGDELVDQLVRLYTHYWDRVLRGEEARQPAAKKLRRDVAFCLREHGIPCPATPTLEFLSREIPRSLKKRGFFAISGVVEPLAELEIWKVEKKQCLRIELVTTTQTLRLHKMSSFQTLGWMAYATGGRHFPGGWATPTALFCNVDSYRKSGKEGFEINYLKHEAQHFADFKVYPKLGQIDLEYRAKLSEFAFLNKRAKSTLRHFHGLGAPTKDSPHPFANFIVVRNLKAKVAANSARRPGTEAWWEEVDPREIRAAARDLLLEHTELLKKAGPRTTRGVVHRVFLKTGSK